MGTGLSEATRATAVLSFSVAVNDRRKNPQSGEWEDVCNWVGCTLFGNRASGLAPYISKGTKVAIEGRLRQSTWEKNGEKRSKLEVIVDEIELMTPRAAQSAAQPQYAPQPTSYPPQGQPPVYAPQGYSQPAQQMPMGNPADAYASEQIPL